MNGAPRVMLLVDADNVSADVIEQAVQRTLTEHGAVHVRRAYCNAETALKQQSLFKRLSMRPMVNLSAGKNSTDIALAVDAIDLVIAERPDIVVLVSSDSDFAPRKRLPRLRHRPARKDRRGDRSDLRQLRRPAAPFLVGEGCGGQARRQAGREGRARVQARRQTRRAGTAAHQGRSARACRARARAA
jgi:hypothetical protein